MIAQGELGLPIFLGVMQFATQAVLERRQDLEPGDVIIQNDPYLGGTHLGRQDDDAVLLQWGTLVFPVEYRTLARHGRHGAGWF